MLKIHHRFGDPQLWSTPFMSCSLVRAFVELSLILEFFVGFAGVLLATAGFTVACVAKTGLSSAACYNVHIDWSGHSLCLGVLKVVDFWDEDQKTPSQSPHNHIRKQNLVCSKIRANWVFRPRWWVKSVSLAAK